MLAKKRSPPRLVGGTARLKARWWHPRRLRREGKFYFAFTSLLGQSGRKLFSSKSQPTCWAWLKSDLLYMWLVSVFIGFTISQRVPVYYVERYMLPMPANFAIQDFQTINPIYVTDELNIVTGIGIFKPRTVILIDHWEDGYEYDVREPSQDTTVVFGDDDVSNGIAPGFSTDVLEGGVSIMLMDQTLNASLERDPNIIKYDARDRIWASIPIVIVRMFYPISSGPLNAAAFEVYPEGKASGTTFRMPVGGDHASEVASSDVFEQKACGTPGGSECMYIRYPVYADPAEHGFDGRPRDAGEIPAYEFVSPHGTFSMTAAYVILEHDNTTVCLNRDGADSTCFSGDVGETFRFHGLVNDEITATANVSISVFTGRIGSTFETRMYPLPPLTQLEREWWTSVYRADESTIPTNDVYTLYTFLLVYNPDQSNNMTVNVSQNPADVPSSYLVPSGKTAAISLPPGNYASRVTCSADCLPFMQKDNTQRSDWGHTLIQLSLLQPEAIVALGWGTTPTNDCLKNSSSTCSFSSYNFLPLWISVTEDATVSVDENGDLVPESTMFISKQQSITYHGVLSTDLSGAKVYSHNETAKVVVTWGQEYDGKGASPDCGTSVYPAQPVPQIRQDTYYGGNCSALGGVLKISTSYGFPIPANSFKIITDLGGWRGSKYIPGSTYYHIERFNGSELFLPIADSVDGTLFPVDEGIDNREFLPGDLHSVRWKMTWNCSHLKAEDDIIYIFNAGDEDPNNCTVSSGNAHDNDVSETQDEFFTKYVFGLYGTLKLNRTDKEQIPTTVHAIGDGGTFTISSDGKWKFVPQSSGENCSYESYVNYTICYDKVYDEVLCSSAQIRIISLVPQLNATDDYDATPRDRPIGVGESVLTNDTHVGPIQVFNFTGGSGSESTTTDPTGAYVTGNNGGLFKLFPNGTYIFYGNSIPDKDLIASEESFQTNVTYTVCIVGYPMCRQANLIITVVYVVAVDDDAGVAKWPQGTETGSVTPNDYGPATYGLVVKEFEGPAGSVQVPANGSLSAGVLGDQGGTFRLRADGGYEFSSSTIPASAFSGSNGVVVTKVNYTQCLDTQEWSPPVCDVAVLSVTVYEVGTPLNDTGATPYDRVIEFGDFPSVLDNDDDGGGSGERVRRYGPAGGPFVLADPSGNTSVTGSHGGVFVLRSDGSYSFDPAAGRGPFPSDGKNFTTSVQYEQCVTIDGVEECKNATLTVTVVYVVAVDDDAGVAKWPQGTETGSVTPNDYGPATYGLVVKEFEGPAGSVQVPVNGSLSAGVLGDQGGTFRLRADGGYEFSSSTIPASAFSGSNGVVVTKVNYTQCLDTQEWSPPVCDVAVLSVTVYEVGTPLNDTGATPYDRVIEFGDFPSVLDNDDDGGGSGERVRRYGPAGGPFVLADPSGNTSVTGSHGGVFVLRSDGSYSFDPAAGRGPFPSDGKNFTTSVQYEHCVTIDGVEECKNATLTVTVVYVVAVDDDAGVAKWPQGTETGSVTPNDYGPATYGLVVKEFEGPAGSVQVPVNGSLSAGVLGDQGGTFRLRADGGYEFSSSTIPASAFSGSNGVVVTKVNYTQCLDTQEWSPPVCDVAVLSVTVYEVGTPLNDTGATPYDRVIEFGDFPSVLDNDDDGGGSGERVRRYGPAGGPFVLADPSGNTSVTGSHGGVFVLRSDGSYSFDPAAGLGPFPSDGKNFTTSVQYEQCVTIDGVEECKNATLTVTVVYVVAVDDDAGVAKWPQGTETGSVTPNDYGPATYGLVVKEFEGPAGSVQVPANGSLSAGVLGDQGGTFRLRADGGYEFSSSTIPASAFSGSNGVVVTKVNYTQCLHTQEWSPPVCDVAVLSVTVYEVGTPLNDTGATPYDRVIEFGDFPSVLDNDDDGGGSGERVRRYGPAGGPFVLADPSGNTSVTGSHGGVFVLRSDGSYSFDPAAGRGPFPSDGKNFTTSVQYEHCVTIDGVEECKNATLTVTVVYVVAVDDMRATTWPFGFIFDTVISNDYGPATYGLIVRMVNDVAIGSSGFSSSVSGTNGGGFRLSKDGTFEFNASTIPALKFASSNTVQTSVNYTLCLDIVTFSPAVCDNATILVTVTKTDDVVEVPECNPRPGGLNICFCPTIDPGLSGLNLANGVVPTLGIVVKLDAWFVKKVNGTLVSPQFSYPEQCGDTVPEMTYSITEWTKDTHIPCSYNFFLDVNYLKSCNFTVTSNNESYFFSGDLQVYGQLEQEFLNEKFTQEFTRSLPFTVVIPKLLEVEVMIEVVVPDDCEHNSDCNGFDCRVMPPITQKRCDCDECHRGKHCEEDICPPRVLCTPALNLSFCHRNSTGLYDPNGQQLTIPQHYILVTDIWSFGNSAQNGSQHKGSGLGALTLQLAINGQETSVTPGVASEHFPPLPYPVQFDSGPYVVPYNVPLSGFPVTYTAFDQAGLSGSCVYVIKFDDVCPPEISCQEDPYITNDYNKFNIEFAPSTTTRIVYSDYFSAVLTRDGADFTNLTVDGTYLFEFCASDNVNPSACCNQTVILDTTYPTLNVQDLRVPVADYENASAPTNLPTPTFSDSGTGINSDGLLKSPNINANGVEWLNTRDRKMEVVCYTVTDLAGNSVTKCAKVQVYDPYPPKINCSDVVLDNLPQKDYAIYSADNMFHFHDNDAVSSFVDFPEDASYAIGVKYLTMVVTDASHNSANLTCSITVRDIQPPTVPGYQEVVEPMDVGSGCYDAKQFIQSVLANITDNDSINVTVIEIDGQVVSSDEDYVLCQELTWIVSITVCDKSNSCANTTVQITVVDTQPPHLTCPYASSNHVLILYVSQGMTCVTPGSLQNAVVADNYGYVGNFTVVPSADTCFGLGNTSVIYTVYDIAKVPNRAQCQFFVRVLQSDFESGILNSTITLSAPNLTLEADVNKSSTTYKQPIPIGCHDSQYGDCDFMCLLDLGNQPFQVLYQEDPGQPNHMYTCCYSNPDGVEKCVSAYITVISNQPPIFTQQPLDIHQDSACSSEISFSWEDADFAVFDNDNQTAQFPIEIITSPESPLLSCVTGTLTQTVIVTVVEREQYPNKPRLNASTSFTISIVDTCPPVLMCPSAMPSFDVMCPLSNCNMHEEWSETFYNLTATDLDSLIDEISATDNCGAPRLLFYTPGASPVPIGLTNFTFTYADGAGNVKNVSCSVQVLDKIPPRLTNPPQNQDLDSDNGLNYTIPFLEWIDNVEVGLAVVTVDMTPFDGIPSSAPWSEDSISLKPDYPIRICAWALDIFLNKGTTHCWLVMLTDTKPPDARCPTDAVVEITGTGQTQDGVASYSVTISDISDDFAYPVLWSLFQKIGSGPLLSVSNGVANNGQFTMNTALLPFYTSTLPVVVTFEVELRDYADNMLPCKWEVNVVDTTPPTLNCGGVSDIELRQINADPVLVDYSTIEAQLLALAQDAHDWDVTIEAYDPPQGTGFTFHIGGVNTYPVTVTIKDDQTNLPAGLVSSVKCFNIQVLPPCPEFVADAAVSRMNFMQIDGEYYLHVNFVTGVSAPYTFYAPGLNQSYLSADDTGSTLVSLGTTDVHSSGLASKFCIDQRAMSNSSFCLQNWQFSVKLGSCETDRLNLTFPFLAVLDQAVDPTCEQEMPRDIVFKIKCAGFCDTTISGVDVQAVMETWPANSPQWNAFVLDPPDYQLTDGNVLTEDPVTFNDVIAILGTPQTHYEVGDEVVGLVTVVSNDVIVDKVTLVKSERTVCYNQAHINCVFTETLVNNVLGSVTLAPDVTEGSLASNFAWFTYPESLFDPQSAIQYVHLKATVRIDYLLTNAQVLANTPGRRMQLELSQSLVPEAIAHLVPPRRRSLAVVLPFKSMLADARVAFSIARPTAVGTDPEDQDNFSMFAPRNTTEVVIALLIGTAILAAIVLFLYFVYRYGWTRQGINKAQTELQRTAGPRADAGPPEAKSWETQRGREQGPQPSPPERRQQRSALIHMKAGWELEDDAPMDQTGEIGP
eukprot:g47168.t1